MVFTMRSSVSKQGQSGRSWSLVSALIACATGLFSVFYFLAYRPGGSDPVIIIVLASLAFVLLLVAARWKARQIPLYVFLVLFVALFIFWTDLGLVFFDPIRLEQHFFLLQWHAIVHLSTIVIFFLCYIPIVLLCGDLVMTRLCRSREAVPAYGAQAFALGLLMIALYLYGLSFISGIYPLALVAPLLLAVSNRVGMRHYRAILRRLPHYLSQPVVIWSYQFLALTTLAIGGSLMAVQTGWPWVVEGDSLALYYNLPELIIRHHTLVRFPYWPIGDSVYAFSLIYVPVLYFGATFLNYLSLLFFAACLYPLFIASRQLRPAMDPWLSVWIFATVPMLVGWLLMTPKIDTLTMFYIVSGLLLLGDGLRHRSARIISLAGLYIGFSIALKFNVILLMPALGIGLLSLMQMLRLRSQSPQVKLVAIFFLVCFISFGVWATRTAYYHQNIFYPYSEGRLYDNLVSSEEEREFMDAFYRESDYHNANFGFNYSLFENMRNFMTSALAHPSFNYGIVLVISLLSVIVWKSRTGLERALYIASIAVIIEWYILVRNEGHYMNFILPLLVVLAAGVLQSLQRYARVGIICLIVFGAIYNHSFNSLFPSVFIAQAKPDDTLQTFPAYALRDEANGILAREPQAVFLTINAPAPHVLDTHLHRFDNVRNFYLAHVFFVTRSPEEALELMRSDGITHIVYGEHGADYVFRLCAARGSACPLYRSVIDEANSLKPFMEKVLEKGSATIYKVPDR